MKKIFIVFLLVLLSLNTYILYNNTSTIKINNIVKEEIIEKKYREYIIGDIVNLNDNPWYVIENSNENIDYVTLINLNYDRKIRDCNTEYKYLNERKYFEGEYLSSLNVDLKEVDGYKIRLITLDEYSNLVTLIKQNVDDIMFNYKVSLKYDWVKNINTLSMTKVDYYDMNNTCINWYIQSSIKQVFGRKEGFINIQPIIHLIKETNY